MNWKTAQQTGVLVLFLLSFSLTAFSQGTITGTISDDDTGETLIGASVVIKGTTTGTTTDIDGNFSLDVNQNPPIILGINFLGYTQQEITVNSFDEKVKVSLGTDKVLINEVEIVGSRISEKTKQAALTVESMDVIAIREAPSGNFYESLGNLKGVDVTSASLGFKIVNTRGFNSTSPVRSLQLIDGVDNQSPGLNFSLGNFLGASDLDVQSVDIIAGASSAYYGPGAFNGVIDMRTKDPFLFPGLTASFKMGERNLFEGAVRWAEVIKDKEGNEKFGYKINLFALTASDWEATNYDAVDGAEDDRNNYSGYDAVNVYGDEVSSGGNDRSTSLDHPGLTRIYRTGYREEDIADYDTENYKANVGLYYKLKPDLILNYSFNYGAGTTIYQGDNRISLRGIQFFQNKIELKKEGKFFIRAYATNEDAGDSYDAVLTANILTDLAKDETQFYIDYSNFYRQNSDTLYALGMPSEEDYADSFPQFGDFDSLDEFQAAQVEWRQGILSDQNNWAAANPGIMQNFNGDVRRLTEDAAASGQFPYFRPGTERFDSVFTDVTTRLFTDNGSRFYDKSALYHVHGEYIFELGEKSKIISGANGRLYRPDSRGTIFEDTLTFTREQIVLEDVDGNDSIATRVTPNGFNEIRNWEVGAYVGYESKFIEDRLTLKATLRVDKNQNFDAILSPAFSLVYTLNEDHVIR
ncbi:MAG: carboxypeptidase-like regulatory domain-containing protein, partial [Bacteroidota bacterium]